MFFQGWQGLLRVIVCALAYGALVLLLHVSGKRTLSKWNAFDLVLTVALGSATVLLSKDVALAEGVVAFAFARRPAIRGWRSSPRVGRVLAIS